MSIFKNNDRLFNTLKSNRFVRVLICAYLSYLIISVAVILPLLNLFASSLYQQQTGRTLHHELIAFNPFTLSITAHHIRDTNPDDSIFWSARLLHVNPSLLQTIVRMAPTLDGLETADVLVHLQKINNDEWNFTDIVTHQNSRALADEKPEENDSNAEVPAFVINQIDIDIDALQFTDSSRSEPFHTSINDINFQLVNFSTVKEAGQPYEFHARAEDGGEFFWHGDVSVKSGVSAGQVGLKNIALKPAWEYFKPYLNFDLHSASFSFDGHYQVSWKDALDWSLANTNLYFHDIDIRTRNSGRALPEQQAQEHDEQTLITVPKVAFEGISVFSQTEKIEINSVDIDNFHLSSWSEADKLGLQQLLEVNLPASDDSPDEPSANEQGQPNNWAAKIQQVMITAEIDWRLGDLENHQFEITPLTLELRDLYTAEDIPATIALAATIDQQIQVSVEGSFTVAQLAGEISAAVQAVPLALSNPLLTPYLNAKIVSGGADIFVDVSIRDALPTMVITRGQVDNFVLRPFSTPQELVKWQQLAWQDTQVDLSQQRLTIPLMQLQQFDSQFIITKDGKTNLHELFIESPSDSASNAAESSSSATESQETTTEPWQFVLEKFQLKDASFRFHDESLVPDFTAAIQRFSGDLTNLSSDTKQLASFDFKGDVDGYAPVTLQGKTQPFLADPKLNAALNFQNIDMGGLSSYSGTYAGWRIARGLLTANLDYSLADGHIVGDNHIVLDQLQFGERVRSNKALDLPLRLALALLTDKNGVATLDVGISGQVDDPGFDISKVIWSAVRNTLVKIATAPFSWLANLVKTDEDLGQVSFNSGSTQLLSKATQKLTLLKEALDQRPNLRLEVRGQYDQKSDTRGLQTAAIKQRLQEYDVTGADIKEKTAAWQKAVRSEYKKLEYPKASQEPSADEEYELLLDSVAVADTDLNALAVERSILVKQFLVQNLQVDNDRVLINSEIDCSKNDSCNSRIVRFDLSDLTQQRTSQPSNTFAE